MPVPAQAPNALGCATPCEAPAKPLSASGGAWVLLPPHTPAQLSPSHPLLGGAVTQRPERTVLFPSPDFPSAHTVGSHPANEQSQERKSPAGKAAPQPCPATPRNSSPTSHPGGHQPPTGPTPWKTPSSYRLSNSFKSCNKQRKQKKQKNPTQALPPSLPLPAPGMGVPPREAKPLQDAKRLWRKDQGETPSLSLELPPALHQHRALSAQGIPSAMTL